MKLRVLLGSAALMAASGAAAQDWPNQPITLVVPFQAGGITDIVARKLEPALSEFLDQNIVVVNMGGHTSVGTRRVIDANPDGYEFLVHETGIMTAEASGVQEFGYRDLTPVAVVGEVCLVAVGRADADWHTLNEIGETSEGPLIAGVTVGGASHMAIAMAAELGGFDIRPVQIGGTSAAFAALIGGQIDIMASTPSSAHSYIYDANDQLLEDPEATPLLYLGAERHALLPNVDAMQDLDSDSELCVPNLVFAPEGTPDHIVSRMAEALEYAYRQPDGLMDFFHTVGGVDRFISGDELDAYLDATWAILEPLAASAGN